MGVGHRPMSLSRRSFLTRTTLAATLGPGLAPLLAAPASRGFRIGACDWSIGKMADPAAFDVAKEIGLDGVQVSLGTKADDMALRTQAVQARYREAVKRTGLAVASLAIGELNNIPYKSDPRTIPWVADAPAAARALECRVILLAFFGNGDLKGDAAGTDEVVRRLKEAAPRAEKAGAILGIESWLSAAENYAIVERVASPAVKIYYDVANSEKMGYDIYEEIRWLGKKHAICEFHMKENDAVLGRGRVDFRKVRAAIEDIGYTGWMQIEGALPGGQPLGPTYTANYLFLRELFPRG